MNLLTTISKRLFLLVILFAVSCSSPQKLLMQEWKVDTVEFIDSLNTLTPAQKTSLTENLKNKVRFTFLPDSVFQVKNENEILKGKWWLSKDKKHLVTDINGKSAEAEIYLLKKKSFRIESEGELNQTFIFNCIPVTNTK
jgi:hypothetical protein